MKNHKKTLSRIAIGVGVLLVLMVTITVIAGRMIDTPEMRSRIQQEISARTDIDIDFQKLGFSLFPAPNLVVKRGQISMPDMFDGTFESLQVFPAIIPLFKGEVGLDKIEIESPVFSLPFPTFPPSTEKEEEPLSMTEMEKQVKAIMNLLAQNVPNIKINHGSLKFLQEQKVLVACSDLQAEIVYLLGKIKIRLFCKSNLAETLSLKGSMAIANLRSKGQIQLKQVRAHRLSEFLFPKEQFGLEESLVDVDLQFNAEGLKNLHAKLQGAVPSLVLYRGDNKAIARELQFQGTLKATEDEYSASVTGLSLGSPQLHLAGQVTLNKKDPQVSLDVDGKDIALLPFQEAMLPLVDDLELVELIGGIVRGGNIDNITIKAKGNSFSESFTLENMHLTGRLSDGKIFLPDVDIEIDSGSGEFELADNILNVQNFRARWGDTTVADISANYVLQKDPVLQIKSGKANLDLEAIFSKASTLEQFADISDNIKSIKGNGSVSAIRVKGPVLRPAEWEFEATGTLKQAEVVIPGVPGPIKVSTGTVATDGVKLSLTDLQPTFQDSSIKLNAFFNNYLDGFPEIDLTLDGSLGHESIQWLTDLSDMPSQFVIRGPLAMEKVHVEMDKADRVALQGKIVEHGGPNIEVDALRQGDNLTINKLFIQDEKSRATVSFDHNNKLFDLHFSGRLHQATLNKIFLFERLSPDGELQGDIKVRYLLDQPIQSTAHGALKGSKLIIPAQWPEPVKLEDFSLTADKNTVELSSFLLHFADRVVDGGGAVSFSEKGFEVDMDFSANGIDWDKIEQNFLIAEEAGEEDKLEQLEEAEKKKSDSEKGWDLPVQGTVRLQSEYFKYEQLTWKPVRAELLFDDDDIELTVVEADLCGISTPGSVSYSQQELSLDFQLQAKGLEVQPTLTCLTGGEIMSTGAFDFVADFTAQGKAEELIEASQGRVEFTASDGKMFRLKTMAQILALLNTTEVFRGKMPDLATTGLPYDLIKLKGDLQNNKFTFTEAVLDGPTMKIIGQGDIEVAKNTIDMQILVSPLKTVDSIVGAIPIIRDITGGTLIAVPVGIKGDLTDPSVLPLSPAAVGAGIFNIMKNILQAPVRLITPQ